MDGGEFRVKNQAHLQVQSRSENVAFVRSCAAAFASQLDCTLEEIDEIRLAVSEAVSNSILHGYKNDPYSQIEVYITLWENGGIEIIVQDEGCGIENLKQAMEPAFSTEPGHMGLGFAFMKSFMDQVEVQSTPGKGTTVILRRAIPRERPAN